ncbi:Oidioi.mRNA.OKI2018_I69.XSR.g15535.t1.cds [Oikopleura dioica]|uniref:Oidioi.mRNA.OKI2018_I69.XSR.g15535.t1.cds n=1 Tax=Oikopleura dioica TaxID=34765 RepID=A0ABN7SD61_OIKDI|nr:Oidioi.mRNA.OKI2018_I69.XSR.g15535.t1.cds [Oikopleura dioica]
MEQVDISIIVPMFNAAKWVSKCFNSILEQTFEGSLEVIAWDDHSDDGTRELAESYVTKFRAKGWSLVVSYNPEAKSPEGPGIARNRATKIAKGTYFALQDVDDEMFQNRLKMQFDAADELKQVSTDGAESFKNVMIGTQIKRDPEDSTIRYTRWLNTLSDQLLGQAF